MTEENLWSEWTECSSTCDAGHQTRTRQCFVDSQEGSADDCDTFPQESQSRRCFLGDCPLWGAWETWTECSQTCNNGVRSRRRDCSGSGKHIDLYVKQHFLAMGRPDLICDGLETVRSSAWIYVKTALLMILTLFEYNLGEWGLQYRSVWLQLWAWQAWPSKGLL